MPRLIDADALRKCFEVPHELKCGIQAGMDEYALKCIDEQPTIDAVPVVLIENCIYTWGKQARRLGSGRESACFEMMAEAAKTILQIHAASQKIKMPTDGVKTVQFKKWKMFEETDLTSPKPITEEDLV